MHCEVDQERALPWDSVSFACGGWLQFYLFGVAKAMQSKGLVDGIKFLGASAGALAAAGIALDGNFDQAVAFCKEKCIPQCYSSISGLFQLQVYVETSLLETLNLEKCKELEYGKLQISVTQLPRLNNVRVKSFDSKEDILQCLVASAAAFPFAKLAKFRKAWYIDGGITDFQPVIDDKTITVSPFYFADVDIKPSRYIPVWWALFPPNSNDTVDWIYNLGYTDGLTWIEKKLAMTDTTSISVILPSYDNSMYQSTKTIQSKCESPFSSPTSISYISPPPPSQHRRHAFDDPQTHRLISMHRFLGFDIIADMTHSYFAMTIDFCLLVLLLFVYKPCALLLLYIELFLLCIKYFVVGLVIEFLDIVPLVGASVYICYPQYRYIALSCFCLISLKLYFYGVNKRNKDSLEYIISCVRCIASLSLLKRFLPTVHENEIKHNHTLSKLSLTYRVTKHMI